jgi:glycosyltransferase involved in cell wall biosynthesis
MAAHYRWADVLVLPSICEGSATVCYEALAAGLSVITTPNAGSVVRDGLDGFVVPIRDARALAEKLEQLASDPRLLADMSASAAARACEFTIAGYAERLLSVIPF